MTSGRPVFRELFNDGTRPAPHLPFCVSGQAKERHGKQKHNNPAQHENDP
jgi:hypothetical protein